MMATLLRSDCALDTSEHQPLIGFRESKYQESTMESTLKKQGYPEEIVVSCRYLPGSFML